MRFALRPLLFQLHLYAAVAISLYVAIMGFTGTIMAFEIEISHLVHADVTYVTPGPARLGLAELGKAVGHAYPGQKISGYFLGEAPNLSTEIDVGEKSVYVDPYTGRILGSDSAWANRVDRMLGAIHSIHQRLTPPRPGRAGASQAFMAWVTVAALFLLLSGIYLWWPRTRFGIGKSGGRAFWYDLHATMGIAAVFFMCLLALTGIMLGFEHTTRPMLYALTGSQSAPPPKNQSPPSGTPITLEQAFAIGAATMPGATPYAVAGPTPGGYFVVLARTPGDHSTTGRSQAIIDTHGAVLSAEELDTAPAGARLWALNRSIHTGDIFGLPSKIVMALASLIIAFQVVSGAVMWAKRVPLRKMLPALALAAATAAVALYTVFAPTG